ncbi:hypothetical protein S4054249_18550 [Pseudoalteromonas luteoviolacea]|uniref:Spore protein YkvP/CgeB glycosyl transferase-like domain-containing protein n=2 Tax=Pseudoalteromonas luteoviolacea TaxID=43657 RepID=A0A0F6ADS0_9GAMM|nr:hypothetical protein S4054249_18550 [Pseudoalteromonas luteoviolacea]AOT14611.1 hypothetical protein S40542_18520 [Pseudoalteromonas luteoviolacea]AOT19525.1 hypothetical protein S4054_18525 [Pseudoalteromonas luteoviolacea]KKE83966.1 hypothetical protein N479_11175 [Pseudoalteromonas luteoviolacea S4054]KZN77360.1 hypothetical protein N481_04715 [Pseudoalteromonas luteoviolacea S4047-1]
MIIIHFIQRLLLYMSFFASKIFFAKTNKEQWVVGVDEISSMISLLGNVVAPVKTVSLSKNPYYTLKYDYHISCENKLLSYAIRGVYAPILLGYLANTSDKFLYVWNTGFLFDRDFEFKFLKSKEKKIVCMFLGNDIRAPKLMLDYCKDKGLDHFVDYVGAGNPYYLSDKFLNKKKKAAQSADAYADAVFNAPIDQMSYLECKQYPLPYMYNKDLISNNSSKFENLSKLKVLHAPSSPLLKGTGLVRAAVKKLEMKGYEFEYVELQNVSNAEVLEHLKSSHIVLNQFYAFLPGVFGIESMANGCAVLQSANPEIETSLPQNERGAWVVTGYWEIYDNLKYLLDNPNEIEKIANKGVDYVRRYHTYEAASEYIKSVLAENGIES